MRRGSTARMYTRTGSPKGDHSLSQNKGLLFTYITSTVKFEPISSTHQSVEIQPFMYRSRPQLYMCEKWKWIGQKWGLLELWKTHMKLPFTNDFFRILLQVTADSSTDRGNPDGGVPSLRKGQMSITNQNPLMLSKHNQKHKRDCNINSRCSQLISCVCIGIVILWNIVINQMIKVQQYSMSSCNTLRDNRWIFPSACQDE